MNLKNFILSCGLGLASICAAIPAWSAEQMTIAYGPFEVDIPLEELEDYARTGQLQGEMARYAKLFSPQQQANLQELLNRRLEMSPTLVSQVAYSQTGDMVLDWLDDLFSPPSDSSLSGHSPSDPSLNAPEAAVTADSVQVALRESLVRASLTPEGLTLVNLMRHYPAPSVWVDAEVAMEVMGEMTAMMEQSDRLIAAVESQAQQSAQQKALPSNHLDLRSPGSYNWKKHRLTLFDDRNLSRFQRKRAVPVDLYIPAQATEAESLPVALISHGIASNRNTMAYLAKHLASHGIAVAVPEHVGSSGRMFQHFFDGLAGPPEPREAIDRPLDMQFVLDHLSELNQTDSRFLGQLDLDRVTAIGQSFGGYTALALGGAELDLASLKRHCAGGRPESLLNFSLLLQCRVAELRSQPAPLSDPRIKAVLAINPVTSRLFNQAGLEKVNVPTMMVASSKDFVVPPGEEQLKPFSWLKIPERYLVVMRNATHFSTLEPPSAQERGLPLPEGLEGPDLQLTQNYMAALSVAFVKRHGAGDEAFAPYLTSAYSQQLSQPAVPLSLVQALSTVTQTSSVLNIHRSR